MALIERKNFDILLQHNMYADKYYFICDDIIAPVIQVLNRKGYKTDCCCSGHPYREKLYNQEVVQVEVDFSEEINLCFVPSLNDVKVIRHKHYGNWRVVVEYNIEDDYYDTLQNILNANRKLKEWADKLEPYSGGVWDGTDK